VQRGGCASGDSARRAGGLREGQVGTVDSFIETKTSLGPCHMVWMRFGDVVEGLKPENLESADAPEN